MTDEASPPAPASPSAKQRRASANWPAGGEALAEVRSELSELKDGLMGTAGIFPTKGALQELREGQTAAESQRLADKAEYHRRFDALGDEIVTKLNGTYIKADAFPLVLAAALQSRRSRRWKWLKGQGGRVAGGALIIVVAAVFLALIHLANPSLP